MSLFPSNYLIKFYFNTKFYTIFYCMQIQLVSIIRNRARFLKINKKNISKQEIKEQRKKYINNNNEDPVLWYIIFLFQSLFLSRFRTNCLWLVPWYNKFNQTIYFFFFQLEIFQNYILCIDFHYWHWISDSCQKIICI